MVVAAATMTVLATVAEIIVAASTGAEIVAATTEIAGNRNRSFSIPEKALFAKLTRQR